jgi:hypothetical protein
VGAFAVAGRFCGAAGPDRLWHCRLLSLRFDFSARIVVRFGASLHSHGIQLAPGSHAAMVADHNRNDSSDPYAGNRAQNGAGGRGSFNPLASRGRDCILDAAGHIVVLLVYTVAA